jgi:hypothetical protein
MGANRQHVNNITLPSGIAMTPETFANQAVLPSGIM